MFCFNKAIFCFQQTKVTCYPERKIHEFESEIDHLQKEYKTFVRKLRELDPTCEAIPWTDRPYAHHKRKCDGLYLDNSTSELNLNYYVNVKFILFYCTIYNVYTLYHDYMVISNIPFPLASAFTDM